MNVLVEYGYPEHWVDSIDSAIELVEYLKADGSYDLFRGQRNTYDIQPSIARNGVDETQALDELYSFASWVSSTPDLVSLHGNQNAILAVAQHYGLKTPLLDFTHSPKVAGFFATDGAESGDTGTIICLNRKAFIDSWNDLNRDYQEEENGILTELIEIDVKNLWRLHAQRGVFLRCHVNPSLLEMFSHFLHIYFPQRVGAEIEKKENIYPNEKSHLEVLFDQYFLIETYEERQRRTEMLIGPTVFTASEEMVLDGIKGSYTSGDIPQEHESWCTDYAKSWMIEPSENFLDHKAIDGKIVLRNIDCPDGFAKNIESQIASVFVFSDTDDRPSVRWIVEDEENRTLYVDGEGIHTDSDSEFTLFSVSEMVSSIYAGMRYLPYSKQQIIRALVRYFQMLKFGVYKIIDECEGIEFSGGGIRGRGFASRGNVTGALRSDFLDLVSVKELDDKGNLEFRDSLYYARYVSSSFEFTKFIATVS